MHPQAGVPISAYEQPRCLELALPGCARRDSRCKREKLRPELPDGQRELAAGENAPAAAAA